MSDESNLKAEIEKLKAENERLKVAKTRTGSISMKVSEKGALSVYGLGRFPVTLYKEQWSRLLAVSEDIKTFIKDHDSELRSKGE